MARRLRAVAADGRSEGARRPLAGPGARQGLRRGQGRRSRGCGATWRSPSAGSSRRSPEAIDVLPGRSTSPAPRGARHRLAHQRMDRIDINEARISDDLGARVVGRRVASSPRSQPLFESTDAGIRKMVVYALGALPGDAQLPTLAHGARGRCAPTSAGTRRSLSRGTAAREGVPVLRQMLDRAYVEQTVKRDVRQDEDQDPVADVMISGLRAAAALKDASAAGVGRRAEPAGPQHESAPGGARSAQGRWDKRIESTLRGDANPRTDSLDG